MTPLTVYGSLLLTGLGGSLHCIGMCGPLLAGFSRLFAETRAGAASSAAVVRLDLAAYHLGRIWTYAALGALAGALGRGLAAGGAMLGWQRPLGLASAGLVAAAGVVLLGLRPARGSRLLEGCAMAFVCARQGLVPLLGAHGVVARFLLGVVMGLLPCGLVYGALIVAGTLAHPLHAALGMVVFGLGTVPALSGVLLLGHALPAWLRPYGTRLSGLILLLTAGWMVTRTLLVSADLSQCPLPH